MAVKITFSHMELNAITYRRKYQLTCFKLQFVFLIIVVLCDLTSAQNTPPDSAKTNSVKTIGINIGLTDFHVRDELASPLTYRNIGPAAGLTFSIKGEKFQHNVYVEGYYSLIKSIYKEYDADNLRIGLRYNYLHSVPVFKNSKEFNLFIGGGLYSFLNFSYYREHAPEKEYHAGHVWYLFHSAETSILITNNYKNSHRFSFQLHLPLVTIVARPPYASGYISNSDGVYDLFGEVMPVWKNVIFQFRLGYNRRLNKWAEIFVQYDFQYSNYNQPRRAAMYMNNFKLGLNFIL